MGDKDENRISYDKKNSDYNMSTQSNNKNVRKSPNKNMGCDDSLHRENLWGESVSNLPLSPISLPEKN